MHKGAAHACNTSTQELKTAGGAWGSMVSLPKSVSSRVRESLCLKEIRWEMTEGDNKHLPLASAYIDTEEGRQTDTHTPAQVSFFPISVYGMQFLRWLQKPLFPPQWNPLPWEVG